VPENKPIGHGRREWTRKGNSRGHGANRASHRRGALRRCHRGARMVV